MMPVRRRYWLLLLLRFEKLEENFCKTKAREPCNSPTTTMMKLEAWVGMMYRMITRSEEEASSIDEHGC